MATVTSFEEFLTAIAGSEDIVLANDIDAQAEGYDSISELGIYCNIDGNGHKISNVAVYDNSGIRGYSSKTLQNIELKNFLLKGTAENVSFISMANNVAIQLLNTQLKEGQIEKAIPSLYKRREREAKE